MGRKKLPVGIENFAEIRQQDFYYVDKTGLIEELLEGWGKEAPDLASSLRILCALLEKHYGRKTILLIDEYDVPLDKAYQYGYYQQMADLIRQGSAGTTQMEIESLIAGGRIVKTLNENLENIWSLLYMTGYLTSVRRPSEGRYPLRIPNREIQQIYKQQVLQWFRDKI